ncbi:hypothetical protein Tco_0888965 [Tanacetum coccineum]
MFAQNGMVECVVVDLTEKTTLLWNVVGGVVPVADVFLQKGDQVNAVNIFGFQMATVRHDVQIQKPATSTLDARTLAHIVLAKKLDMASIAHVLLKLTPTQDPRASMGPKEIDHIGGGVAATNFGAIRVEYPKEESYSRFQGLFGIAYWNKGCLGLLAEIVTYKGVVLDCISKQSKRQGLDMTKLSSIHRTLTLFALSSDATSVATNTPAPTIPLPTEPNLQAAEETETAQKKQQIGSAVGGISSAFYGFNLVMPAVQRRVKGPMWLHFLIGAPPVIVFSSACAGLAGGAVPALAQLASSSYHAAVTSPSLSAPPPQKDDISKSRTSSTI